MYVKVLNPQRHGKVVYANKGSAQRAVNYLQQETREQGRAAAFFGAEGSGELSGEQLVQRLDGNRKGLTKDEAKFHSLVLSPSPEEIALMGNDPQALQRYTRNVMELYAQNFKLQDGRQLHEADLVWGATIHQQRKNRGTDEGGQGEAKPGLHTHVHVIVSARDAAQKITLNPQGRAERFNRVQFQAQAHVQLEVELGIDGSLYPRSRPQRVREKATEIQQKAAGNATARREKKPLTPEQIAAKDARLVGQVGRVNGKLTASQQLDPQQVLTVARERQYDNTFYFALGQLECRTECGAYTHAPYEYLRTGRLSRLDELNSECAGGPPPALAPPRREAVPTGPTTYMAGLQRSLDRLSRDLAPKTRTQDVRSEEEKRRDYEHEF